MPKEGRRWSPLSNKSRSSPYQRSSSCSKQSLPTDPLESEKNLIEWEEARCPVCIDHPHNAILLLCTSHEKGCRPYMCDTSYRHSNCFDQFRKSSSESSVTLPLQEAPLSTEDELLPHMISSEDIATDSQFERTDESAAIHVTSPENELKAKLQCPLCRGQINGWTVVKQARRFMNKKSRSCACETCDYSGTYKDLRKHARRVHPFVRPSEVDPERQRSWRRLERQRDFSDFLSSLQSFFVEERNDEYTLSIDGNGWFTVLLFFRVLGSGSTQRTFRRRLSRRLWGETNERATQPGPVEEDNETSDDGSAS